MTIKQALRVVELIKDESDGETYTKSVGHKNGADIETIDISLRQALRVVE